MLSDSEFTRRLREQQTPLMQYAKKLLPNVEEAEDLLQDTLLRVWEKRDQFREDTHFDRWCRRVMRRRFLNLVQRDRERKMVKVSTQCTDFGGEGCPDAALMSGVERMATLALQHLADQRQPDLIAEAEEIRQLIDQCLAPPVAMVVKLRLKGWNYNKIAEMLGISAGTARVRFFDARQQLIGWLTEEAAA